MMIAVLQPNYIPWKGYFDIINDVDLFVFYTDVQYTVQDWRNRNIIKTANGLRWLSVPVGSDKNRLIYEVEIHDQSWQKKHYETLKQSYSKAPYFKLYQDFLEDIYLGHTWNYLYELDICMIEFIAKNFLGIKTQFADSRDFPSYGHKNEKLASLISSVLHNEGGGHIYPDQPRKIILSPKYIRSEISKSSGKIMMATQNILRYMANLLITYLSWIYYLTSAKMLPIIYGAGEKLQELLHGLKINFAKKSKLRALNKIIFITLPHKFSSINIKNISRAQILSPYYACLKGGKAI